MQYRRTALALAAVIALAGCAPDPTKPAGPAEQSTAAPTSQPAEETSSPVTETSAASEAPSSEPASSDSPAGNNAGAAAPVEGVTSDILKHGVDAAGNLGYSCKAGTPKDKIIVEQVECEKSGSKLTLVEYSSPRERGPHIKTWAPQPKRPVGEKWLLAGDQPRDFDRVAEAMMRGHHH